MEDNPYQPPVDSATDDIGDLLSQVRAPATALIVVSTICLIVVVCSMIFSIWLVVSGTVDRMPQPANGMSKEAQVEIRIAWSAVILISNGLIFAGALKMRSLRNYSFAKLAAILAMIPCIGPCYIIGIPFGIWAFKVLNQPDVKDSFQ